MFERVCVVVVVVVVVAAAAATTAAATTTNIAPCCGIDLINYRTVAIAVTK